MRQRASGDLFVRLHHWIPTLAFLSLLGFVDLPTFIEAESPIFKYEDDSGIITFTEQWDSIPGKYRERVVTLNPATLKPVEGDSSPHRPHASPPIAGENPQDVVSNFWENTLDGLSIPLSSQFQLGVGLTGVVLIIGMLLVRHYTSNPFTKVLLKLIVVILVGGTGALLYLSHLNANVSIVTGEPVRETTTVEGFMQTLKNSPAPLLNAVENSVVHPLESVIEQSKEATLGQATRTVDRANAATRQMEKTLQKNEGDLARVGE